MKFEELREESCDGVHGEDSIVYALFKEKEVSCETGWHDVDPKRLVYGFTSFGETALTREDLRGELAKCPEWAEPLIKDVMSVVALGEKTYDEAVKIRKGVEELPAELAQEIELSLKEYLRLFDEMLDNREFASAPGIVGIGLLPGKTIKPSNWFNQEYVLTPYCEFESAIHRCTDASVVFEMPRVWWEKTAPKLSLGLRLLSTGLKIGFAGLPLGVDAALFTAMKDEVGLMKELAGLIKLEGGAESDVGGDAGEFLRGKGAGMLDVRDERGADVNRIARMQLAQLLGEIAPKNYKGRKWGSLRRVRMRDNTYRWLCEEHAREYKD